MRALRQLHHVNFDILGDFGRADMFGQAIGIFGVEIIKAAFGLQFGDAQRLAAQNSDCQLTPLNERLGEQGIKFLPRSLGFARDG